MYIAAISISIALIALTQFAHAQQSADAHSYGLQPRQVAIVINDDEPNSVLIGEYYRTVRNIPVENVVHVHIKNRPHRLTVSAFNALKAEIDAQLRPETKSETKSEIQAMVLVWTAPYAVDCNSITSALTLGYDAAQCKNTCATGKPSRYYDSSTFEPYTNLGLRLSMLMPIESVEQAKALIDRGNLSSFNMPNANAYFLVTSDRNRNTRKQFFPRSGSIPQKKLTIKTLKQDTLEGAKDVMFYMTGLARVEKLETLHFMPGALADHLTSSGGDLLGKAQMSSLRWLEAGATASFGSVSEPCNYWQKFPNPNVLMRHYLSGASAIEAYWSSVAWPAQGLFIGDPLAAPYRH